MASSSVDHGIGGTDTSSLDVLHPEIIETRVLAKLDGRSIASVACTSNLLRTLCNRKSLWRGICNSTWDSAKHPLVQQTICSFPGSYRSFYNDSFPVLCSSRTKKGGLRDQVKTRELISAVDIHYEKNPVHSKVLVTNVHASSFPQSLFCVDLIESNETVEMPLKYEGDENECMLKLEERLTLSWIVIDPTLKRAANVSSLRPVCVKPYLDGTSIKVIYATILSGDSCGTYTAEFVECRIVAIFGCEEGKNIELRKLSFCVVDMDRTRLNGEKTLRILQEAMVSGERKKQNGEAKEVYSKYLSILSERDVKKRRQNMLYSVLWIITVSYWFSSPFA
ncbi:hypothetical protein ACET3Z_010530 [Daucus carota]